MSRLFITLAMILATVNIFGDDRQRVGLVLSGGGAKGIAHIGVIQALEDHDIAIDYVTGTSMGAIVGSLYAIGYSPAQMMALLKSPGFANWSQGIVSPDETYYILEQKPSPALFHLNVGSAESDGSRLAGVIPTSLINPLPMSFAFMDLYGASTAQCGGNFDNLFVPFRCVCSNVYDKHKVVLSGGSLADAVRASMSFPLVFQPIMIDSLLMYDGGIYDNFPVDVMRDDFNPDIMIGVDVSGPNKKPNPDNVMQQLEDMIMQRSDYNLPPQEGIRIKIDLEEFGLLDFGQAQKIYDIGYRHGMAMIDSIKRRVTARTPAAVLEQRRRAWRQATPTLTFDSVKVSGCNDAQAEYLRRIFARGDNNPATRDTFSLDQARTAFYRAVVPGRFRSLVPHAVYDPADSLFTLNLHASIKRNIDVGAGGYITSSANSYLYLSGTYNNLTTHFTTAEIASWIGQSYQAALGRVEHALATDAPMKVSIETAIMRQKFHENETFFYQVKTPTFITNSQFYIKGKWAVAPTMRSIVEAGVGYGHLWDSFYASNAIAQTSPGRDHTRFDLGQLYVEWRRSTLDNPYYPTQGASLSARLTGVIGNNRYQPYGAVHAERQRMHWGQLQVHGDWYIPLSKHFSWGMMLEGIASTRPLLSNYNATMVSAPAFTPTSSSYNAYNPAFRSNSWVAGGINPVWVASKLLQVRGSFNAFVNARRITEDPVTYAPRYAAWFDQVHFFGELRAMLTTPYTTVSAYINYQSYPARNWNVGISLGLFHLAPTFF